MSFFEERFTGVWSPLYLQKFAYKMAMMFLILGSIQCVLLAIFRVNLLTSLLGEGLLSKLIYVLIASATLYLMVQRDVYLPFLGPTLVPCTVLQPREPPGATRHVTVTVPPHSKVLYWASEPSLNQLAALESWEKVYGDYENAGVAVADASGMATLHVRDPQPYKVPFKGRLGSHVHYRVCGEPGWIESVKTIMISDEPEGFQNFDENFEEVEEAENEELDPSKIE